MLAKRLPLSEIFFFSSQLDIHVPSACGNNAHFHINIKKVVLVLPRHNYVALLSTYHLEAVMQ